ncbi:hypothetical protein ACLGL1_05065 [Peptococcus simiae]|uniref:hypothetical protein n=1 Tax=Peptococcus simiae TaxID=1643805 RepID=UPI00397FCCC8
MTKENKQAASDQPTSCQPSDDLTCAEEVRLGLLDLFAAIDADPAAQAAPADPADDPNEGDQDA